MLLYTTVLLLVVVVLQTRQLNKVEEARRKHTRIATR
jgi:hypothetical protein